MSALAAVYAALLYLSAAVLVVGVALKIRGYLRTPAPLKIPTTPAPTTRRGVALRMAREVVFFESLFRSSKWTWIFGWTFHAALLVVLLRRRGDPVAMETRWLIGGALGFAGALALRDAEALERFAKGGGNLILTDGALQMLPRLADVTPKQMGLRFGYVGYSDLTPFLLEIVQAEPDITLKELAGALVEAHGVRVQLSSLHRALRRAGYSYKKRTGRSGARQG